MKLVILLAGCVAVVLSQQEYYMDCKSNSDCPPGRCCTSGVTDKKLCQPNAHEGEYCNYKTTIENGNTYKYFCPCEEGLKCYSKRKLCIPR